MAIERKKDKYGNKMRHRGGALLRMTAAIVFWLLVWQLLSFLIGSELLLPSPWAVVRSFCGLAQTTEFYRSILHTLLRVAAGFAAGMAAGLLAGTLTAFSRAADVLLTPLKNIIKATPVTSFIVLILLYFSSNVTPSAVAFLAVLPICWSNVCEGLRQTDKKMTELAHAYAFGRKKTLREIYLRSAKTASDEHYMKASCISKRQSFLRGQLPLCLSVCCLKNYLCINSLKIGIRKARPGGEARALNTGMQAVRPNCNINPMHMPNTAEMRNETYD